MENKWFWQTLIISGTIIVCSFIFSVTYYNTHVSEYYHHDTYPSNKG